MWEIAVVWFHAELQLVNSGGEARNLEHEIVGSSMVR